MWLILHSRTDLQRERKEPMSIRCQMDAHRDKKRAFVRGDCLNQSPNKLRPLSCRYASIFHAGYRIRFNLRLLQPDLETISLGVFCFLSETKSYSHVYSLGTHFGIVRAADCILQTDQLIRLINQSDLISGVYLETIVKLVPQQ